MNTTYYQPRLDAFLDDYRVSSETSLSVQLTKLALFGVEHRLRFRTTGV